MAAKALRACLPSLINGLSLYNHLGGQRLSLPSGAASAMLPVSPTGFVAALCLLALVGCGGPSGKSTMSEINDSQMEPARLTDPGILVELPDELSYLVESALEYGRFQLDEHIFNFLDSATPKQMQELASIAERVRLNDHYPAVNRFLDQYPITDHEQAACLYFLFGVLDHADLSFEP